MICVTSNMHPWEKNEIDFCRKFSKIFIENCMKIKKFEIEIFRNFSISKIFEGCIFGWTQIVGQSIFFDDFFSKCFRFPRRTRWAWLCNVHLLMDPSKKIWCPLKFLVGCRNASPKTYAYRIRIEPGNHIFAKLSESTHFRYTTTLWS